MKFALSFLIFGFLLSVPCPPANAQSGLTSGQIERVKACKRLLEEVDQKPWQRTIDELEQSRYPELNIQIMEAMAHTYEEMVREQNVAKLKDREWLYGMIALNMANLQFGGKVGGGRDAVLNRMITRKLKEHLPADVFNHPGFAKSVE